MRFFITFEGIEGSGKTTQIRLLATFLESFGHSVVCTREPGGCKLADDIRAILLNADNRDMTPATELLLYGAARAQHVSQLILPALESGMIVICDRFRDATVAYQSFGRNIDRREVDAVTDVACGALLPDMTILIDCAPEKGLARAIKRIDSASGPREERFELESLEFHNRVRNGYLSLAADEPDRFFVVDGGASIETVSQAVTGEVSKRLREIENAFR